MWFCAHTFVCVRVEDRSILQFASVVTRDGVALAHHVVRALLLDSLGVLDRFLRL